MCQHDIMCARVFGADGVPAEWITWSDTPNRTDSPTIMYFHGGGYVSGMVFIKTQIQHVTVSLL